MGGSFLLDACLNTIFGSPHYSTGVHEDADKVAPWDFVHFEKTNKGVVDAVCINSNQAQGYKMFSR